MNSELPPRKDTAINVPFYFLTPDQSKEVLSFINRDTARLSVNFHPYEILLAIKSGDQVPSDLVKLAGEQIKKHGSELPEYSFRAIPISNDTEIDKSKLFSSGGKFDQDQSVGTWVGVDDKVIQKIEGAAHTRTRCIVIVYDDSQLLPLTPEEIGEDYMSLAHRKKPKDSRSLNDVIEGVFIFDFS